MQTQGILVGELQLGQTLNHCIRDGKKSEFDLLLSMLSNDVTDQDQFSINPLASETLTTQPLHEKFDIPTPQTLTADSPEQNEYSMTISQIAQQEGILAARLQHCLRPEALNFQPDITHGISNELYSSLSPAVVQRFTQKTRDVENLVIDMEQLISAQQNYDAELVTA